MRAQAIIEHLCEERSELRGALFLNSSNNPAWLPAPFYAEAGTSADQFAAFAKHLARHMPGAAQIKPLDLVNELVRRHGLVVVGYSVSGEDIIVTSRRKQLSLSDENLTELEETLGIQKDMRVFWKPDLDTRAVELSSGVVFYGEFEYKKDKTDDEKAQRAHDEKQKAAAFAAKIKSGAGLATVPSVRPAPPSPAATAVRRAVSTHTGIRVP